MCGENTKPQAIAIILITVVNYVLNWLKTFITYSFILIRLYMCIHYDFKNIIKLYLNETKRSDKYDCIPHNNKTDMRTYDLPHMYHS